MSKLSKTISAFLDFEANNIQSQEYEGKLWICVADMCKLLDLSYDDTRNAIMDDSMLCLGSKVFHGVLFINEEVFFGWLLNLDSDSKPLYAYKMKCYEVLHKAFSPLA